MQAWGVSLVRKVYWAAANHLRSLPFLNYRLGQWVARLRTPEPVGPRTSPLESTSFDPATYTINERRYLDAFPSLIGDQVLLQGAFGTAFSGYIEHLVSLLRQCRPTECRAYVLVVPHKAQVTPQYKAQMEILGARFTNAGQLHDVDYPFLKGIQAALEAHGLNHVNLSLPQMQTAEQAGTPVFAANDLHLNAAGQQLLADVVLQHLAAQGDAAAP